MSNQYACIAYRNNQLKTVPLIGQEVEVLVLAQNEIDSAKTLNRNQSLRQLDLSQNKIKYIDFQLSGLVSLNLRMNKIEDIQPLVNFPSLEILKLGFNQIRDVNPLSFLKRLRILELESNKLQDISAIQKLKLQWLDISANQIRQLPHFEGSLQVLLASKNLLESIDTLAGMNQLVTLNVSQNRIANVDSLKYCSALEVCWLDRNQIETKPDVPRLLPNAADIWLRFGSSNQNPCTGKHTSQISASASIFSFDGETNMLIDEQQLCSSSK